MSWDEQARRRANVIMAPIPLPEEPGELRNGEYSAPTRLSNGWRSRYSITIGQATRVTASTTGNTSRTHTGRKPVLRLTHYSERSRALSSERPH